MLYYLMMAFYSLGTVWMIKWFIRDHKDRKREREENRK